MALSFRRAHAEDLERPVAIHAFAYPDGRRYDARVRHFRTNPLGTLDDLWVVERTEVANSADAPPLATPAERQDAEDGLRADGRRAGVEADAPSHLDSKIVGHSSLFALEAWFGGERVRVGGVSSVAVAPEVRRSGIASRLLAYLHDVARTRGDALTVLYPFRQDFYGRVGYAATTPYRHLRFSPAALSGRPELRVRPATGGVEGHVAWAINAPEPQGDTALVVHEMAALSARAARSWWAAVAAQRDHVTRVEADAADDDPLDRALVDGRPR